MINHLDGKSCIVRLDNGQELNFDPNKYQWLKLGYASTIYKSQGKTIDEVYVLHDRTVNQKISYVALSRQPHDLKVFVNQEETRSLDHMISQVARDMRPIFSLEFITKDQLQAHNQNTSLNDLGRAAMT